MHQVYCAYLMSVAIWTLWRTGDVAGELSRLVLLVPGVALPGVALPALLVLARLARGARSGDVEGDRSTLARFVGGGAPLPLATARFWKKY